MFGLWAVRFSPNILRRFSQSKNLDSKIASAVRVSPGIANAVRRLQTPRERDCCPSALCKKMKSPPEVGSQETGLTTPEAKRRLLQFGPNDPVQVKRSTALVQILSFCTNPLVLILLIASIVSGVLGEIVNAIIIIAMVLLSIALNFVQSFRSQRAAERLRQQVAPMATVLRDSKWTEILRRDLVPGDTIRMLAGDLVPADARLMRAQDLHMQEAALTGESLPAEKEAIAADVSGQSESDRNRVFLGTSVVSGSAVAVVTATGRATAFGDIAARLATRPPITDFERGMRRFGMLIMRTVVFLVLFVFLVSILLHRNPLESLLFAIALAVGLTPEFLPMIITVTLARGATHMAKQKVIVKHLEAIQNFGSIDILCSDKTGTLTSGVMTLNQHLDPLGAASERVFLLLYLNSFFQTGISNPIDDAIRASRNPLDEAVLQHDHADAQSYYKLYEMPFDFARRRLSVVLQKDHERIMITKGAPESVLSVLQVTKLTAESTRSTKTHRASVLTLIAGSVRKDFGCSP